MSANVGMLAAYGIDGCGCWACVHAEVSRRPFPANLEYPFITCGTCGNKRCPRAESHTLDCTGSNEPGQEGATRYPAFDPNRKRMNVDEMVAKLNESATDPNGDTHNER